MRVVLMGPPGAGKGTQAEQLVNRFQMKHLSSGDIFRQTRASGSDLAAKLAEYMDAGKLIPDEIVVEMMAKAIASADGPSGLLLDGFPRTVAQAEALDKQLAEANTPLDAVVLLTCDDETIIARITGRRSCPSCGKVYHVTFMPPASEGVCDACGSELIQRDDDTESVVSQRLDAYRAQTEPVLAYYKENTELKMIEADGRDDPKAVCQEIAEALA